jgi:hypothetical protein
MSAPRSHNVSVRGPGNAQSYDSGDGGSVEGRLGKLESDVEYIKRATADQKTDVRELRNAVNRVETRETSGKTSIVVPQPGAGCVGGLVPKLRKPTHRGVRLR